MQSHRQSPSFNGCVRTRALSGGRHHIRFVPVRGSWFVRAGPFGVHGADDVPDSAVVTRHRPIGSGLFPAFSRQHGSQRFRKSGRFLVAHHLERGQRLVFETLEHFETQFKLTINQGFHLRMNSGTWTETSKLRQSAGGRSSNPNFRNANGCPRTGRANPNCGSCASYALCDRIECHTLCACSSKRNWARGTWRVSALNWPKSSKRWVPALRSASSSHRVSIHCWKWKF